MGGIWAQSETEEKRKRKNETRMERRRDRGGEGQKEQVVRREGLMSNERLTRPQLILSLYLCFAASLSTKVITTPSSIILLSLLFTGNCLIICYRFGLLRIILSVIRSISSGKHTAPFLPDALWGLSWVTPSGCSQNLEHHFFRHKVELPWLICHCQKHNKPFRAKAKGGTGSYRLLWTRGLVNLCKWGPFVIQAHPLGLNGAWRGMIIWLLSALDNLYFILM